MDSHHLVKVSDEQLYRGFYTRNSEVGTASFGLCAFVYKVICDKRVIWDASDGREIRIRHTGGAPKRFSEEGKVVLERYATAYRDKTV